MTMKRIKTKRLIILNLLRTNLMRHYKILILFSAVVALFYLIFSNNKPIRVRPIKKYHPGDIEILKSIVSHVTSPQSWDSAVVQVYKEQLGVDKPSTDDIEKEPCPDGIIVSKLTGDSVDNWLWEYASLLAIGDFLDAKNPYRPYLSDRTKHVLLEWMTQVNLPSLIEVPTNCYELEKAIVVGDTTELKTPTDKGSPLLLIADAIRYKEVNKIDRMILFDNLLNVRSDVLDAVEREIYLARYIINNYRKELDMTPIKPNTVCVYIHRDAKDTDFLLRAIQHYDPLDSNRLVILMCDPNTKDVCIGIKNLNPMSYYYLKRINSMSFALFAIMTKCTSIIVNDNLSALAAMVIDSEAIIHANHRLAPIANTNPNWYVIA